MHGCYRERTSKKMGLCSLLNIQLSWQLYNKHKGLHTVIFYTKKYLSVYIFCCSRPTALCNPNCLATRSNASLWLIQNAVNVYFNFWCSSITSLSIWQAVKMNDRLPVYKRTVFCQTNKSIWSILYSYAHAHSRNINSPFVALIKFIKSISDFQIPYPYHSLVFLSVLLSLL